MVDSAQDLRTAGYTDGVRSVSVIIFRQPGANIIDTVDRIKDQLPFLEAVMPQGIKTTVVMDRTTTIRASVNDVERTLIGSVILVILVVFVFLRSPRATLIPSVAVPVSLIGTFAVMYLLDYSLDNLSLMALTVATGFVVDDAIVVMENITRHLEEGMEPFAATSAGRAGDRLYRLLDQHVVGCGFHSHPDDGRYRRPAVPRIRRDVSTAIVVSMVVSLTTTPMMCAHLLKAHEEDEQHNWLYRDEREVCSMGAAGYRGSLRWVLDNPALVLIVLALTITLNVVMIIRIPDGFFPAAGHGRHRGRRAGASGCFVPVHGFFDAAPGGHHQGRPGRVSRERVHGRPRISNGGFVYMALKPLGKQCKESDAGCDVRQTAAMDVINRLRPKINRLPVASAFHAAGTGFAYWRPRRQRAVSVHHPNRERG